MKNFLFNLITLLRWNKPSGRIILLIPAGWGLWLAPSSPPNLLLFTLIMIGGIVVSGAGCIANDLWDKEIDSKVKRTKTRPLANKRVRISTALILFFFLLLISLQIIFLLPLASRNICLILASIALVPIIIYPSSKRWFKYPQLLLSFCWGFAVLIPWAASESNLDGGFSLLTCWLSTMIWTFGFDTIYAMSDKEDDKKLGLHSSALSLGGKAYGIVSICYGLSSILIAFSAFISGVSVIFWPIWLIVFFGMQREVFLLKRLNVNSKTLGSHFPNQVLLGSLIWLGLILGAT